MSVARREEAGILAGESPGVMVKLFNVEEYHRMAETGILHEDDHVELVKGRLFNNKTGNRRLFDVREYHKMIEARILREGTRLELIEGEIVEMAAMGSQHAACVYRLIALLTERLGRAAIVGSQCPIRLNGTAEPEPDIALLKPRDDFYASEHPGPVDVLLVVEISDTTLKYDRDTKLPLYAKAGIPEVWIVNLPEGVVEAHFRPEDDLYKETVRAKRGDPVSSRTVPSLELAANDILG